METACSSDGSGTSSSLFLCRVFMMKSDQQSGTAIVSRSADAFKQHRGGDSEGKHGEFSVFRNRWSALGCAAPRSHADS